MFRTPMVTAKTVIEDVTITTAHNVEFNSNIYKYFQKPYLPYQTQNFDQNKLKLTSTYFSKSIFDWRCSSNEPRDSTESMKHGRRFQWPPKSKSKIIKTKTKSTSQSDDCNQLTEIFKGHRTTIDPCSCYHLSA